MENVHNNIGAIERDITISIWMLDVCVYTETNFEIAPGTTRGRTEIRSFQNIIKNEVLYAEA